jgi:NAD(P)-dependent dehydrogenase (short-subunit alcohol dehydrogenase family)
MADLGYDGKVAIITGAGGGLGRQHALLLASRGARIVVNDLGGSVHGDGGNEGPAHAVVKELEALGAEAIANTDSVANAEGGKAIIQSAIDAFGQIDIVINNAGILRDKAFHNMTPDLVEPVFDVHLRGAFYVTQPAWVHMREQGYGRVVNTTSGSGLFGMFGQANYGAAKMGLVGLTRVLANEGAKHNIKVNAIAPIAYTRMTEEIMPGMEDKLKPELVSPVVAWLAHEECPTSGEVFSVAGGYVAKVFTGLTPGIIDKHLTPEVVRDRFDEIRAEDGYIVPTQPGDEFAVVFPKFE